MTNENVEVIQSTNLERALIDTAASLAAALSILQRANKDKVQPRLAVASSKMFATMMIDCQKSLDRAREALRHQPQEREAVLDPELVQPLKSALRFAASRAAITSEEEHGVLAALTTPAPAVSTDEIVAALDEEIARAIYKAEELQASGACSDAHLDYVFGCDGSEYDSMKGIADNHREVARSVRMTILSRLRL